MPADGFPLNLQLNELIEQIDAAEKTANDKKIATCGECKDDVTLENAWQCGDCSNVPKVTWSVFIDKYQGDYICGSFAIRRHKGHSLLGVGERHQNRRRASNKWMCSRGNACSCSAGCSARSWRDR